MRKALLLVLALVLGSTPGLLAQISTGNIYGTVTDESGAVLPGAAVNLTSEFGTRTTTSGSQGDFRFLNLTRGRYKVNTSLAGFTSVSQEVSVVTGENVNIAEFPGSVPEIVIRCDDVEVALVSLVTVSRTVNVPVRV